MSVVFQRGPAWATRSGETLTAELSYRADGKKAGKRTWQRRDLDPALGGWFDAAADGDRVEVVVDIDGEGRPVQVRMARPPAVLLPAPDPKRLEAVEQFGGGANPYTFIPTLPREQMPPGLGDAAPVPHGVIDPASQWSGFLTLRVVIQTPLLLPDPETATRDGEDHPTYPVRLGADGKPLLHGASVKGALRSAYETVTGSRYGVFRGHGHPLAYRRSADRPNVTPARVEADGPGGLCFRLCTAPPLAVPLYDPPARPGQRTVRRKARATGSAQAIVADQDVSRGGWAALHGREVWYTTRAAGSPGKTRPVVDQIALVTDPQPPGAQRGWLSITGRSIERKANERLFVPAGKPAIPVTEEHHALWHAVLASYHDAAEYNEPGLDRASHQLDRSRHVVPSGGQVPDRLAEGDLVYLDLHDPGESRRNPPGGRAPARAATVTAIHPVMIGRLPYKQAPAELLDHSLHPAAELRDLSPADRLFGWAPTGSGSGRRASSGYRGRLRIASVTCDTADWLTDHGPGGVTVAALSTPKPTQFRFYTAADQAGTPVPRQAGKDKGYTRGLRGRKAYWYPNPAADEYWMPGRQDGIREWQAPRDAKSSQTSTHRGWVKEETQFTIRLFLDAVPRAELAPLIWLVTQPGCPLRLGAAKPHGFGAVTVSIHWPSSELRTGEALRGCWLDLARPEPAGKHQIEELADEYDELATTHPVLAPAVAAWRKVTQGLDVPVHYPRTRKEPEAETYRWFVANEQIDQGQPKYGFALPHALENDQRLPLLPPARENP